jgi:hypothetical protein
LIATYRELRAKEAEAAAERHALEQRYEAAAREVTWDGVALLVVAPDLPYLPDCKARDGYNAALNAVRKAGLEAADAAVDSLERASLIREAARGTYTLARIATPRSDALVEAARQAAKAREQVEIDRQRAEQRALLEQWGDAEQLERFDAGVLPEAELRATVGANIWPNLPRYVKLVREDVTSQCAGDEACEVQFGTSALGDDATYAAGEWAALKAVRSALADREAEITVVRHWARCRESHHEVCRLAAHVTLTIAGLELERRFAVGS